MKGYVIKKTSTATNEHPTRAGEVIQFIIVKRCHVHSVRDLILPEHCYKTKKTAERYMNQYIDDEYKDKCWESKYEVVEVQ